MPPHLSMETWQRVSGTAAHCITSTKTCSAPEGLPGGGLTRGGGGGLEHAKFGTAHLGTTKVCRFMLRCFEGVAIFACIFPLCPRSWLYSDALAGSKPPDNTSNQPKPHRN